jgi:hypothetical protein
VWTNETTIVTPSPSPYFTACYGAFILLWYTFIY